MNGADGSAPAVVAAPAAAAAAVVGEKPPRLMPTWWLCWQQLFWFTQFLTFNLLLNILLPFRVLGKFKRNPLLPVMSRPILTACWCDLSALVGGENKAEWLAFLNTVANFVALTSVFWGAASDGTRTRFGRRRPYVIAGQLLACFGLFLMSIAPKMWLLTSALVICKYTANPHPLLIQISV